MSSSRRRRGRAAWEERNGIERSGAPLVDPLNPGAKLPSHTQSWTIKTREVSWGRPAHLFQNRQLRPWYCGDELTPSARWARRPFSRWNNAKALQQKAGTAIAIATTGHREAYIPLRVSRQQATAAPRSFLRMAGAQAPAPQGSAPAFQPRHCEPSPSSTGHAIRCPQPPGHAILGRNQTITIRRQASGWSCREQASEPVPSLGGKTKGCRASTLNVPANLFADTAIGEVPDGRLVPPCGHDHVWTRSRVRRRQSTARRELVHGPAARMSPHPRQDLRHDSFVHETASCLLSCTPSTAFAFLLL